MRCEHLSHWAKHPPPPKSELAFVGNREFLASWQHPSSGSYLSPQTAMTSAGWRHWDSSRCQRGPWPPSVAPHSQGRVAYWVGWSPASTLSRARFSCSCRAVPSVLQLLQALHRLTRLVTFRDLSSAESILALFPENFHQNLKNLLTKIILEHV